MEYDLLLTLLTKNNWKQTGEKGALTPELFGETEFIRCVADDAIEEFASSQFTGENELVLVVIDPLKLRVPVKHETVDGIKYLLIYGDIVLDAVIEKINVFRNKNGRFNISVKHFD